MGLLLAVLAAGFLAAAPARLAAQTRTGETADGVEPTLGDEQTDAPPTGDKRHDSGPGSDGGAGQSDTNDDFFSASHRRDLYEQSKLHFPKAALMNAALPGLGNFYAQQYFIGGLGVTLMTIGGVLITYGLVNDSSAHTWVGVGTVVPLYPLSIGASYVGVRRYNRQLRESLRVGSARRPVREPSAQNEPSAQKWWRRRVPEVRGISVRIPF